MIDERPDWWDLSGWLRLRRRLIEGKFGRVYDLQTSGRSAHYFRLFPTWAQPEWSGIAPGCSLPDRDPNRDRLHDVDRQFGQFAKRASRHAAGRPVLESRRHRPFDLPAVRPAGARQFAASSGQALAGEHYRALAALADPARASRRS